MRYWEKKANRTQIPEVVQEEERKGQTQGTSILKKRQRDTNVLSLCLFSRETVVWVTEKKGK